MTRFAHSGSAMATMLLWSFFLISVTTAKAIARDTPAPTLRPHVPIGASTSDTAYLPSLSSVSPVSSYPPLDPSIWIPFTIINNSYVFSGTFYEGPNDDPTSFPPVPSTSRQFVISPLSSTSYPSTWPHPTKRADATPTSTLTPTSIFDGDVWSWSDLPKSGDPPTSTDTWSAIFDSIESSFIHKTPQSWVSASSVARSASAAALSESASEITITTLVTTTVTTTRTRPLSDDQHGPNILTAHGPVKTHRPRAEVTTSSDSETTLVTKTVVTTMTGLFISDADPVANTLTAPAPDVIH